MAIFFGVTGGLTAIGPIAGGFLTQWTWRAIFWINIPVALIALYLIWRSQPDDERRPARMDYRGTVLITGAMGLIVLALEQSSSLGLGQRSGVGVPDHRRLVLMGAFVAWELRCPEPLLRPADLQGSSVRGGHDRARNDVDRVRPVLLLRERLLAGLAGPELVQGRRVHPLLLPRVRDPGPDRRADARSPGSEAPGGDRRARSRRSGSSCSPASSPTCHSAPRRCGSGSRAAGSG